MQNNTTNKPLNQNKMKKETLEEAAERLFPDSSVQKRIFIKGAKWQQERMLKDMQEYAEFCIMCDRKQMPLLLVEDWYKHYKSE